MQGSPAVIAALNACLASTMALHEQAHSQEHRFEVDKYGFSDWFDKIETKAHEKLTHYLMNRIGLLGGEIVPAWAFQPKAEATIGPAMTAVLSALQATHTAYGTACEVAEKEQDYVTEKMIWGHLEHIESWIGKFEARIAQLAKIGEAAFLAEYL